MSGPALLAAVAVAAGVTAQAVTGFGFSLVCAPFLVAAYRAPAGVQLNLLLSMAVNLVLLLRERRNADFKSAGLLLVPAAAATVALGAVIRSSHASHANLLTAAAGGLCL